jgi:toxin ParE1/3/4
MAQKIVWSYEASEDLIALTEYIAKDSIAYAASFAQEILDESRILNQFSKIGRIVPELNKANIRELLIKNYRIIYSIEKTRIVILGIVHGRRDLKSFLENKERN